MIIVGGFFGAYTFVLKGGVFCNAQTANFVMLAVQIGVNLVKWCRKRDIEVKDKLIKHLIMLAAFVIGGIASTVLCIIFKGKAIWFAEIPLFVAFIDLLYADLSYEKDKIHRVPHGH